MQYADHSLIYVQPSCCRVDISRMAAGTVVAWGRSWLFSTPLLFMVASQAAKTTLYCPVNSAISFCTVDLSFRSRSRPGPWQTTSSWAFPVMVMMFLACRTITEKLAVSALVKSKTILCCFGWAKTKMDKIQQAAVRMIFLIPWKFELKV